MTSPEDWGELWSPVPRRRADAITRLKRVAFNITHAARRAPDADLRWLTAMEAQALFAEALECLDELVPVLDEEGVKVLRGLTKGVHDRLRALDLAAHLSNNAGRTPEETEVHEARAAELRRQAGA